MKDPRLPDRPAFGRDPFGYGIAGWMKWMIAQDLAGIPADPTAAPTAEDLKSPVLWMAQAQALTEAAAALLQHEPAFDTMPSEIRGVCDTQYCAVVLMLVGYSLEVCLKGMVIMREGVEGYSSIEHKHRHHRLADLASFIPDLSAKDKIILKLLTEFVMWAGRYPDPGSGRIGAGPEIFRLSEKHQINGRDLFDLSARVMGHIKNLID